MANLHRALETEQMPAGVAHEACRDLYQVITHNTRQRREFWLASEPALLARWPDEAFVYSLKAWFYLDYAWEARGTGWANSVTEGGWKLLAQRLQTAEAALNKAWELDPTFPNTPLQFMTLELGQGKGRQRMELWFERAMAFPANRYDALYNRAYYLEPRWYGTEKDCLAAAREVLKSDEFRGRIPLILYHVHESLAGFFKESRPNYWTEPQVWLDIKAAFDRYFEFAGDDTDWRHNYVKCAWRCQQWEVLKAEIPKLKWVNHSYFGGKEAFEQMCEEARVRSKPSRASL
jgi:hypothetical protein